MKFSKMETTIIYIVEWAILSVQMKFHQYKEKGSFTWPLKDGISVVKNDMYIHKNSLNQVLTIDFNDKCFKFWKVLFF